jgi:glycosyltransferase involved in cell wall biosynthesis
MKTSVIITVYNRPLMLRACLRAIAIGSARCDEVVVSDDGSDPESAGIMRGFFSEFSFPIRYIRQEHEGFRAAAARNNGIRESSGDYLVLIDCDMLLLPDALECHFSRARRGCFLAGNRAFLDKSFSSLAINGSLNRETLEDLWLRADKSHIGPVARQFERNRVLRKLGLARRHKPKILGCHFSLFREDVERINGFDQRYVGWGYEDDDFSMRLHKAGVRGFSVIREARALHVWHEPVPSKPGKLSDCVNLKYFKSSPVPSFCAKGLVQQ